MDLVAEMVLACLARGHAGEVEATRVCPPYRRRLGRLPGRRLAGLARNADRVLNRHADYPRHLRRLARRGRFDVYHVVDHSYAQLVARPARRPGGRHLPRPRHVPLPAPPRPRAAPGLVPRPGPADPPRPPGRRGGLLRQRGHAVGPARAPARPRRRADGQLPGHRPRVRRRPRPRGRRRGRPPARPARPRRGRPSCSTSARPSRASGSTSCSTSSPASAARCPGATADQGRRAAHPDAGRPGPGPGRRRRGPRDALLRRTAGRSPPSIAARRWCSSRARPRGSACRWPRRWPAGRRCWSATCPCSARSPATSPPIGPSATSPPGSTPRSALLDDRARRPDLAAARREAGLARSAAFRWEAHADRLVGLYREVAARAGRMN